MSDQGLRQPGHRLRVERESRGMSQEEAAKRLNLTVTFIQALETDDYERLPEATFVRGYIRNYARELDLPADELVAVFSDIMEEKEEVPEAVEVMPSRRRRWLPVVVVALVLVVVGAVLLWPGDNTPDGDGPASTEEPASPSAEQGPPAGGSGTVEEKSAPEQRTSASETAGAAEQEPVRPGPGLNGEEPDSANLADRLDIRFSGECWLEVRDAAGEVVFEGRRNAGVTLNLSGEAPFDLRIGDASAVESLSINDQQQTMPSNAAGEVVRLSVP